MIEFAHDLAAEFNQDSGCGRELPTIDICITKIPYFHDKAVAIEESGAYPSQPHQIHLTGHDSVIQILDTTYYPPTLRLDPLVSFFPNHNLYCGCLRASSWGDKSVHDLYVDDLREGRREHQGGKKEWAQNKLVLQERTGDMEAIGSTKVEADITDKGESEGGAFERLLTPGVEAWIREHQPYLR